MKLAHSQWRVLAAAALLVAGPALAAEPVPEKIAPGAKPASSLSDKLNNSNGVIAPKEVDPGIEKPAPKANDPNVVPPPSPQAK